MASVRGVYITGKSNCKTVFYNRAGQALLISGGSAGTFENYNQAHLATYQVAASEKGASGVYEATVPTIASLPVDLEWVMTDTDNGANFAGGDLPLDSVGAAIETCAAVGWASQLQP